MFLPVPEPITFPSGMRGEFRELSGQEEDLIGAVLKGGTAEDKRELRTKIMRTCWVRCTEPGPYGFAAGPDTPFDDLLTHDVFYYSARLRNASAGPELQFKMTGQCGHMISAKVDMSNIPAVPLPASSVERVRKRLPFEFRLPKMGRLVRWWPLRVGDRTRIGQALQDGDASLATTMLTCYVREIEGFDRETGLDPESHDTIETFLIRAPRSDRNLLREHIHQALGGVDFETDVTCDTCKAITTTDVTELATDFLSASTPRRLPSSKSSAS